MRYIDNVTNTKWKHRYATNSDCWSVWLGTVSNIIILKNMCLQKNKVYEMYASIEELNISSFHKHTHVYILFMWFANPCDCKQKRYTRQLALTWFIIFKHTCF